MAVWQVCFLGVPRASKDGVAKRPRATVTWALLASLVLPRILLLRSGRPLPAFPVPVKLPRTDLARRFWGDKTPPTLHLRQALPGLRKIFCDDSHGRSLAADQDRDCGINADLDSVWVTPGYFESDVEFVMNAYHRALDATSKAGRLKWLAEAEKKIEGRFLEGCFRPDREGAWFRKYRDHVHDTMVTVLLALASALIEDDNVPAAQAVLQKALRIEPRHERASRMLWETATHSGQGAIAHLLDGAVSLRDATARFRNATRDKLTLKEGREFDTLIEYEINRLTEGQRDQFFALALFPAPFSPELALEVCRIAPSHLKILAKSPLLDHCDDSYSIAPVIRDRVRSMVPTSTQRRCHETLFSLCGEWIDRLYRSSATTLAPFGSIADSQPFMNVALDWAIQQDAAFAHIGFISYLQFYGLENLALRGLPYVTRAFLDQQQPDSLRIYAGKTASLIHMHLRDFKSALPVLEDTLTITLRTGLSDHLIDIYSCLMNACHYSGDTRRAIEYGRQVVSHYLSVSHANAAAGGYRFLSEMQFTIGQYDDALKSADEALRIRLEHQVAPAAIADALYWKGRAQLAFGDLAGAALTFREALDLWQTSGDPTGTAHCLRHLGLLRAQDGHFSEARAQIEYAMLLHERAGDLASAIAARDSLGQMFLLEGRRVEARAAFERCLIDSATAKLSWWSTKYRDRIAEIDGD